MYVRHSIFRGVVLFAFPVFPSLKTKKNLKFDFFLRTNFRKIYLLHWCGDCLRMNFYISELREDNSNITVLLSVLSDFFLLYKK